MDESRRILSYFPAGLTPRHGQRDILEQIEQGWKTHEVIVIVAPPATGKTELAVTVANWRAAHGETAAIMPPSNVIVEQTEERYPALQALHRQDYYRCEPFDRDCATTAKKCEKFCPDCPFVAARSAARKAPVRLLNPYTYLSHKLYSKVAIFDEAHQLVEMLQDVQDIKLWRSQYTYPDDLRTVGDVVRWGQAELRRKPDMKLRAALTEIIRVRKGATVQYAPMRYRGQDDTVLLVKPRRTKFVPQMFWPSGKVDKIVLMSATIGPGDVEEMGLAGKRVLYLECESPIPAPNRPLVYSPACNMGHKYTAHALPVLAKQVKELLLQRPEKGLIHLPYALAEQFRTLVADPRLMFHDRNNKQETLDEFRASPPSAGRVLVASGLYEGVDLPYDAARWQVIGKVPFLWLGDARIEERAQAEPEWYAWSAIKKVIQAHGRIVRRVDDKGTSYIFDTNFGRLLREDQERRKQGKQSLFPKFFRDALRSKDDGASRKAK